MYYIAFSIIVAISLGAFVTVAGEAATFGDDLEFLKKHVDVVVLSDESESAQVAIVPTYQGRVMTTTASGVSGDSYGWINRALIESREIQPHINAYGGEDRFWMGPEGGQFGIFFEPGVPFDLEHWQTPPSLDTEPFETVSVSNTQAVFRRHVLVRNHSGTEFDVLIDRTVRLLSKEQAADHLGITLPVSLQVVTFETDNTITNNGVDPWTKERGLLSIWILGMFNPSPNTTIVIPYVSGPEDELGPVVNDAYFGKVPIDRLANMDSAILFRGDGQFRSKIGVSQQRSKPVLGSYAADKNLLTLVFFTKSDESADYVNSMWEIQEKPYNGDVVNAYNDGAPAPGKHPLGPFYELESSSAAVALEPNASISHVSRTMHIQGSKDELDAIARTVLGISVEEIENAL